MNNDLVILRQLANEYANYANSEENLKKMELHYCVNDLKMKRPIVLINELPWNELNFDGSLSVYCSDPDFRGYEWFFRSTLFQLKHFPADMILTPYVPVYKHIHDTGIGVNIVEEVLITDKSNGVAAHKYENQFNTVEDIQKLKNHCISYDESSTKALYTKIATAIGDIIPVKIVGETTGYGFGCKTWDTIATLMGADELMYKIADDEDYMHMLVDRLTDIFIDRVRQYEDLNLIDADAFYCHAASALTSDLPKADRNAVKAKNVWGRGLAQILAMVSPQMHYDLDIKYMKRALEQFGLVYYGCCEPLDKKIDEVSKIDNLRKISITPWADINIAAESIGKKYVLSAKPNPGNLANFDAKTVEDEVLGIVEACKKNNVSFELVLKDVSTIGNDINNLINWEKTVMGIIRNA